MFRSPLSVLLLSLTLLSSPVSAQVRSLSLSEAQGSSGTFSVLKLARGKSVTIQAPKNLKIYKGWLDNNLILGPDNAIDSDRPFDQGASLIYIVPRNNGDAKLTLVGMDQQGHQVLLILKLSVGSKGPDLVAIRGQDSAGRFGVTNPKSNSLSEARALAAGLALAMDEGKIIQNTKIYNAVVTALNLLKNQGYTLEDAASNSGLTLDTLQKLIRKGQGTDDPIIVPKPPGAPRRIPGGDIVQQLPPPPPISNELDAPKVSNKKKILKPTPQQKIALDPVLSSQLGSLASNSESNTSNEWYLRSTSFANLDFSKVPKSKVGVSSKQLSRLIADSRTLQQKQLTKYSKSEELDSLQVPKSSKPSVTEVAPEFVVPKNFKPKKATTSKVLKTQTIALASTQPTFVSASQQVKRSLPEKKSYTTHQIANALAKGLVGMKISSMDRAKVQDAIWHLRTGKPYRIALKKSGVSVQLATSILKRTSVVVSNL